MAYFAASLNQSGLAPPTITVYLSAVGTWHREQGLRDPCHHNILLRLVKRGIARSHHRPQALREPITPGILRRLLAALRRDNQLRPQDQRMLAAAFCSAFHGFLRVGEFTTPTGTTFNHNVHTALGDITWHPTHLRLRLKQSKTDQIGRGTIVPLPRTGDASCPYNAMTQYWKDVTATSPARTPLFHFADGCPLSSVECRHHLRRLLSQAGYQASLYNTHSFRIGAATTAAAAGATSRQIKHLGRWRSKAYKRYIRPTQSAASIVLRSKPRRHH